MRGCWVALLNEITLTTVCSLRFTIMNMAYVTQNLVSHSHAGTTDHRWPYVWNWQLNTNKVKNYHKLTPRHNIEPAPVQKIVSILILIKAIIRT